jgi:hypothetical protein
MAHVKCYNCDKMGHFARDCRQPKRERCPYNSHRCASYKPKEAPLEGETKQDKATTWLRGVAMEDVDVKDIILASLMKDKDFVNA